MAEIVAKIGLNHAKFDRGLDEASRGWEAWAQKVRRTPVQIVPEKSARDSARVFEEIERARQEHVGNLDRERIERALGGGSSGKRASDSAAVFEEQARAEDALASTRRRRAYDEANTVGRIRMTQRELVTLAKQRDAHQVNTVARLRIEQQIEERMAQLRGLQRQQQISNILPSPQDVDRRAGGIIGLLRRKFSGADLFKDTLKGLGFGLGAGAIGGGISEFFSMAAEKAKATAAHTQELYQGTLRIIGVIGGPRREMELMERQAKEINTDIALQQKLVKDLNANPINFLTDAGRAAIREAEEGVQSLIRKQAELRNQIHAGTIEEQRRNDAIFRQGLLQVRLAAIELAHGNELAKIDAQIAAVERERRELEKQGALPSTLRENDNQRLALDGARKLAERNRTEELEDAKRRSAAAYNLATLELRHASDLEKYEERRRALLEELNVLQKRNASPAEIEAAKQRVQALADERQIEIRNQRERIQDLERQQKLNDELTKAELRDAGEAEKKQIRLNGLRRDYDTLRKRNAPENEIEANRNQQRALMNEIRIDRSNASRELNNALATAGSQLAGQNPNAGPRVRPRGRSERERLADRAAQFQLNAEEGVRTGKTPDYIARMAKAAVGDFKNVGDKMAASTAQVSEDDANALGSPLLKTNQILEEIKKNLTPTKTK